MFYYGLKPWNKSIEKWRSGEGTLDIFTPSRGMKTDKRRHDNLRFKLSKLLKSLIKVLELVENQQEKESYYNELKVFYKYYIKDTFMRDIYYDFVSSQLHLWEIVTKKKILRLISKKILRLISKWDLLDRLMSKIDRNFVSKWSLDRFLCISMNFKGMKMIYAEHN